MDFRLRGFGLRQTDKDKGSDREKPMNKKILCFALCAMLLSLGFPAEAQQTKKLPRVGFLSYNSRSSESPRVEAFRKGIREHGYAEGQNIVIEYCYANRKRDRLPQLAAELVRLKVDVIVATGTPPTRATQRATKREVKRIIFEYFDYIESEWDKFQERKR